MSVAVDYPVSLAIEDFVPVLFTACGVLMLRHRAGTPTVVAAALIGGGGFTKVTAKLVAAAGGPDLVWLRGMLFPLLSLGFALLYRTLVRAAGVRTFPVRDGATAILILACAVAAIVAGTPLPMMVSTTVFALLAGVHLIASARARADAPAAALFAFQLAAFLVLGPLGARPQQTVALQWVEQLCNTAAQAAFLVAARRTVNGDPAAPVTGPAYDLDL